jgi:thioredoxin 1
MPFPQRLAVVLLAAGSAWVVVAFPLSNPLDNRCGDFSREGNKQRSQATRDLQLQCNTLFYQGSCMSDTDTRACTSGSNRVYGESRLLTAAKQRRRNTTTKAPRLLCQTTTTALGATKFRNFDEMLESFQTSPVLVAFYAKWCGPCRLMHRELDDARQMFDGEVAIFNIDMELFPALGARYHIEGLPTAILFKEGEQIYRIEGLETAEEMVRQVKDVL